MEKKTITDVHIANDDLITEVARIQRMTKHDVKHIIDYVGFYLHGVISSGIYESVMIPGFGKFQPKERQVLARTFREQNTTNGKYNLTRILIGQEITQDEDPCQQDPTDPSEEMEPQPD